MAKGRVQGPIAELWVGTHAQNPALVENDGQVMTLQQLIEEEATAILGPDQQDMPYMFKILDAGAALSWQLHEQGEAFAKPETWTFLLTPALLATGYDGVVLELYIGFRRPEDMDQGQLAAFIKASRDHQDLAGHYQQHYHQVLKGSINDPQGEQVKAFSNHIQVKLEAGQAELYLNGIKQPLEVKAHVGLLDGHLTVNIPAGTVHALIKGMVFEVQKAVDKTLRLYDHGRCHPERPLHIDEAQTQMDFQPRAALDFISRPIRQQAGGVNLVLTSVYTVDLFILGRKQEQKSLTCDLHERGQLLVVVQGQGTLTSTAGVQTMKAGDILLIPAALGHYTLASENHLDVLKIAVRHHSNPGEEEVVRQRGHEFWEK